jgi:PAS domain S-box-containing protein
MPRVLPSFADLPLRDKGLVVVSIPVLALLVALVALTAVQREEQQAERLVQHSREVRESLQLALRLLIDAETGTRGYLLTNRREWLQPYHDALRRFPPVADQLEKLIADNPSQMARLRHMKEIAGVRLERLVVLQGFHGPDSLSEMQGALALSRESMEQVRGIFAEMQSEEEALLLARTEHALRMRGWLYALIGVLALSGLGGGLLAAWLFGTQVARRVERVTESAGKVAQREALPPADRGRDEVGRLSVVLHEADALLAAREKELRDAHVFLEHLMDTSPAVVVRQDPYTLAITYVSPNAERILGYPAEEIRSQPDFWMSHIHPDDREHVRDLDARAIAERADQLEIEYRFQHGDGHYLWLVSYVRIEYDANGRASDFLGHRLDISARRRAEEALREREAGLDAANRELEAFSYSVSHDLRAPLRSIDGFSQALIEDYADRIDQAGRSYLQRVRAATQRMGMLIDDLLNLSRVTRSPLRRTQVNLSALAQSVAQDLQRTQPERAVEFVVAPDLEDDCDANLMRIVLENLLENAWKFTARHATARIEFGRAGESYFVRDDGAGFDAAYKSKLFGAFQRLHQANDFAGTGIGLATVQRIIRRHGGQVSAEGAPEKGATFSFTLHPGA